MSIFFGQFLFHIGRKLRKVKHKFKFEIHHCISEKGEIFTDAYGRWRIQDKSGHVYQRAYTTKNDSVYWRCQYFRNKNYNCKAKIQSCVDGWIRSRALDHNHPVAFK